MRTWLAIIALVAVGLSVHAAELRPPENLPRYDFAITVDPPAHRVLVAQQATWTNTGKKPVEQLVLNVHSHFTPPKTAKEVDQLGRLLELFRLAPEEGIFFREAFQLEKVEGLTKVGAEWQRDELKHEWNKDLATALIVKLPEPLAPGESATIALTYTMELPQRQGRWGQWKGVTFLSNWHPVFAVHDDTAGWQPTPFVPYHQPWYNEAGVYTARIRLPTAEQIACTGSVTRVEPGETTKDVIVGPVVSRDFALLTSARYQEFCGVVSNGTGPPVKVKCLAFPEHEFYARVLIKYASLTIENFAKWFGPLPYPEFTIAESYFGWNGNECGGLVMIDERVFDMPHLAEKYVQYLICHETGHQWFYNVVGTNGYKETFMDEAIVTHLTHRMLDGVEGPNNDLLNIPPELFFLPQIKRANYRYSSFYTVLKNDALMPAVQPLEKYENPLAIFAAVYDRGAQVVGMIEHRLGTAAFQDFMRRVYAKYYFRIIRVADFRRELEEYTGHKWDAVFEDWLPTAAMSDWSVDGVTTTGPGPAGPLGGGYRATVMLSQRAEINARTQLGFSFDGGATYPVRVPVRVPRRPVKKDKDDANGAADKKPDPRPGQEGAEPAAGVKPARCEWADATHLRVEVDLPGPPDQVMVDPDLVIPDADPVNNRWRVPVTYRPRPLYTFLDETNFTNDYDKWNVIYGPFFYGAAYPEGWFTRATVLGVRAGLFRTEEFRGGVYAGYRPTFGDTALGFDAVWPHVPDPLWEVGAHGELSVGQFMQDDNYNPDRAVVWLRHILEPTSSLYLYPREYVETYVAYQHNWLPTPRRSIPGAVEIDPLTTLGYHYRHDTRVPYWAPEYGYYLDGNLALGLPLFGENRWSGLAWGQAAYTWSIPTNRDWWNDITFAARVGAAVGLPKNGRLFTLGGDRWFRGFDVFERQGSCMWVASLEARIPVKRDIDFEVMDRLLRLRTFTLAPFYDVGDIYIDGRSLGPVAHAVGVGFCFQVDFFSFLERATLRIDVAQTIGRDTSPQFWLHVQQPF